MSQPQTTIAPRSANTLKQILEGDAFKLAVGKALPRHLPPDRFLRVAQTAMTRTPKLKDCDQASFLGALLTLSALGLEPDGRRAHLIPFENRRRGVVECQLIVDYKGLVELAMRSGDVSNIHADVVCEQDDFDFDRGVLVRHKIDFRKPRGAVYAVYALARFKDGGEKCEVMTREEIEAIRARSRAGNSGPWVTDWNEMAKKTAFRRLSKWLPLSPEYRDALDADADTIAEREPAIPVMSVNAPFALPEAEAEREPDPVDDGDVAPQPKPEPPPGEMPSIKEQLAEIVVSAGFSFDEFRTWAGEMGHFTSAEAAAIDSFDMVPQEKAKFFVKNKTGMLKGISMAKAGAK